jgi:DNA polymerase III alpha subunit
LAFVPLHVKSQYSIGLGTASIPALVQHAGRLGFSALGLTDLENVYGQVQFHAACRAHALKPITGVELRRDVGLRAELGSHTGRLVVLARDALGYSELCQIVTARRNSPAEAALLEVIAGFASRLFLLTDDTELLCELVRLSGPGSVRALVVRPQPRTSESELRASARRLHVPLVADIDALLLERSEWQLQRLVSATHLGQRVDALPSTFLESNERLLRAPAELAELFSDLPEAIAETQVIADGCSLDLLRAPYEVTQAPDVQAELAARCRILLQQLPKAHNRSAVYVERLESELQMLRELGLAELFRSVAGLVEAAKQRSIPLAARGSAVSSLVGHVLGFSPIDPVEHGLYFERFANAARRTPPDIDLDVASRRRDELIEWFIAWRGPERTARISALHTFQQRSAHREGLKTLGAPARVIDSFLRHFPAQELAGHAGPRVPSEHLPRPWREKLGLLAALVGLPRHLALHPGGVVLADAALHTSTPLERTASGACVTQYDAESISRLGLKKIDLLGSHCLDELDETLKCLRGGVSYAGAPHGALHAGPASLPDIPLTDAATFELIDRAQTLGCFQLESPLMRSVLASLPMANLSDLTQALAIVRPGPASGQAKELFVARARGEAAAPELHPAWRERLRPTHGVLLFEEDILFLLSTLAGIQLATAEALRVRLGDRAADREWLERVRQRLLQRAEGQGFSAVVAERAWSEIVRFGQYSFNKAHAASQALLAYQTAFLKCHAPLEFGRALLDHHAGLYPPRVIASELARRGVRLLAPCVQESSLDCSIHVLDDGRAIRLGLARLKGLRASTRARLLASREALGRFSDIGDLLRRVRPQVRELRALLWSGACDELLALGPADYPWVHEALRLRLEAAQLDDLGAVIRTARDNMPREPAELVERYRGLSRVQNELTYLQMHVSDHPLRILRGEAARCGCVPSARLSEFVNQTLSFAGIIAAARSVPVRNAGVTQFLTLEDEDGLVEARLSPDVYARLHSHITTPGPFLVRARVLASQGALHLAIQELLPFKNRPGVRWQRA